MSSPGILPDPALEACLVCGPASTPEVLAGPSPYELAPLTDVAGWLVRCPACGLRGAWRPTRAQAIGAWNRHVTRLTPVPVEEVPGPVGTKE